MIIAVIFRRQYNRQFYFSFPLLIFGSNILEIPLEIKRHMFASMILKAFEITTVSESSYDRETVSGHFTWRLIAEAGSTELLLRGPLTASLGSVKTSLGYTHMFTGWASKQEAGYIHPHHAFRVHAKLLWKFLSPPPIYLGRAEVLQVFK